MLTAKNLNGNNIRVRKKKELTSPNVPHRLNHLEPCMMFLNPWDIDGSRYKVSSNENSNKFTKKSDNQNFYG